MAASFNNKDLKDSLKRALPERIFALLGLSFGILFLVITPPFQAPDEQSHFYRAYQISEGRIIGEQDDRNTSGGYLPKGLYMEVGYNISFHKGHKLNISDITRHFTGILDTNDRVFFNFGNTVVFSPVPYIPQSIAMLIGRIFGIPPIMMLYLGRLFNLLAWILLVYFTIKIAPVSKWLFILLALTPMSLFLASSLSADSITNGLSFLLIALFLHLSSDRDKNLSPRLFMDKMINQKAISLIFILSLSITLSKQIYAPLILLYFLIPPDRMGSKRRYFITGALVFLSCLAVSLVWTFNVRHFIVPHPGLSKYIYISPGEQISFVMHHPIGFLASLIRAFKSNSIEYFRMYIGILGWLDTPLPNFIYISYFLMILFTAIFDNRYDPAFSIKSKMLFLAIFLLIVILIGIMVYATWTAVGGKVVDGIQGRYFIAFSSIFFLLFYNKKIELKPEWFRLIVILFSYAVLRYTLIVLIARYYNYSSGFMNRLILFDLLFVIVLFFSLKRTREMESK